MRTTANQKKAVLQPAQGQEQNLSTGKEAICAPIRSKLIAKRLVVTEQDIINMNQHSAATCRLDSRGR